MQKKKKTTDWKSDGWTGGGQEGCSIFYGYVTILFSMCCFRECWLSDKFTPWFSNQTPLNFFISVQMTVPSQWPLLKIRKCRLCQLLLSLFPFQEWTNSSCQLGAACVHAHWAIPEGHLFRCPQNEAGIMSARCERPYFPVMGIIPVCFFQDYLWLSPF